MRVRTRLRTRSEKGRGIEIRWWWWSFIPSWTGVLFDGGGDGGDGGDHLPLVSLGLGINPQVSWDMMMVMVKGEEDQTIEEGLDLW